MHDHDDIDFTFSDLPTRPGPARAAVAPEQDPVERRLEREREAAPHIAYSLRGKASRRDGPKMGPQDSVVRRK
jgi:hypothetical protein